MFFSSKCRSFHNATLFGFCTTHILNTGVLKLKKKIRRQKVNLYPSTGKYKLAYAWPVCKMLYHVSTRM